MKSVKIIFFAFILASIGIISSATFSSVNAVQCNPNTQNGGCGSGNGCSCTDKSAIKLGDYSSCTCGPTGGQEACYHTICPVGYYCSGSGISAYCKLATPKPETTTPTTSPCVETCTTTKTCLTDTQCTSIGGNNNSQATRCNKTAPSKYWCATKSCTTTCSPTATPTVIPTASPFPGTPTPSPVPVTPTPSPFIGAQCYSANMYSPNWTPITTSEFYNLLPNSQIYFCVTGNSNYVAPVSSPLPTATPVCTQSCSATTSCLPLNNCRSAGGTVGSVCATGRYKCGLTTCTNTCTSVVSSTPIPTPYPKFDMARFTINGVLRPETTTIRPNTEDFCDLYTIPSNTYSFTVQGEIHHNVLGWL